MFTKNELQVLQQALEQYQGPYGHDNFENLVAEEIKHYKNYMEIALQLRIRFEEILTHYWKMEVR